jgi:hypothetical protein
MRLHYIVAIAIFAGVLLKLSQPAAATPSFRDGLILDRAHISLAQYYKYRPAPYYHPRPYLYTYPPRPYRPSLYYRYPRSYYYPPLYYFYGGGPRFRY